MVKRKRGRAARNARKAALGIPTLFKGKKGSGKFVSSFLNCSHIFLFNFYMIIYLFIFRRRSRSREMSQKLLKLNKDLQMKNYCKKIWPNNPIL